MGNNIKDGLTDYRPLFKKYFGSGYFIRKAVELRINRTTLWQVLSGRKINPAILDPCLNELNERLEFLNSSLEKTKKLMETHKELRGFDSSPSSRAT